MNVEITEYGYQNELINPWLGEERVVIVQGINGRRPMLVENDATHQDIEAMYLSRYKKAGRQVDE